jgi:hypothetical protein
MADPLPVAPIRAVAPAVAAADSAAAAISPPARQSSQNARSATAANPVKTRSGRVCLRSSAASGEPRRLRLLGRDEKFGWVWDPETPDRYLADPRAAVSATKMAFPGKDAAERPI